MDENNLPPVPTDVIELRHQRTELNINGADCNYFSNGRCSVFGRWAYLTHGPIIIVWDLFLGVQKTIIPKSPNDRYYISHYVHLSANKGFVVYAELDNLEFGHQKSRPNHAAIVSINFDDGTYEYLDTKSLYPERIYELITHPAPDTVMFMSFRRAEVGDDPIKLHIYKFDDSIKKIKHEKSIDILRSYHFFHLLDEKIVFVRINLRLNFNETIFEAIMYIDHNDRCLEIPNTGVCLKPRPSLDITDIGRISRFNETYWHGTKLFHFLLMENAHLKKKYSAMAVPFMWAFEMKTKKCVDSDGFLSFIRYRRNESAKIPKCLRIAPKHNYKEIDKPPPCKVRLIRVAIKTPDILLNLCWLKIRESGVSEKVPSLKLLTNPTFYE